MEHIKNEIKRCETELRKASGEKYSFLYIAQQALCWALDPVSYASPVDIILKDKVGTMDIQVDSEDCSAVPHLPLS